MYALVVVGKIPSHPEQPQDGSRPESVPVLTGLRSYARGIRRRELRLIGSFAVGVVSPPIRSRQYSYFF
jgi:hypothetical protein